MTNPPEQPEPPDYVGVLPEGPSTTQTHSFATMAAQNQNPKMQDTLKNAQATVEMLQRARTGLETILRCPQASEALPFGVVLQTEKLTIEINKFLKETVHA